MAQGIGKHGELFRQLYDVGYLIDCARRAARGKRRRPEVARFLLDLEPNCFALADALYEGSWRPGPYRAFWIRDPKRRQISAAPFADRVVHHALVGVLEPWFERRFVAHSYACRRGKGTHAALRRFHALAQRHRHVLRADLTKFFPSLDHAIVKREVRRVIADRALLRVLDRVIDGSNEQEEVALRHYPGDDLFSPIDRRRGIPIGNLTSQFLANVVLDRLDHRVMDDLGHGAYVRYCDDFAVFADDRDRLVASRDAIAATLADLRLGLHPSKTVICRADGPLPFLGFVVHGRTRRLQRAAILRATRRSCALARAIARGEQRPDELRRSFQAFEAHAAHGRARGATASVKRRVRMAYREESATLRGRGKSLPA